MDVDRCRNCNVEIDRAFLTHCPDCGTPAAEPPKKHIVPRLRFDVSDRARQGTLKTLMLFVVVGALVVSAFGGAQRDADGSLTEEGQLLPTALLVGDCLDLPDEAQETFGSVHAVPCQQPHHLEKYLDTNHPADRRTRWPGDDAVGDFAIDRCYETFEAYVGRAYEDALELDFYFFYPSPRAWASGDRSIQCFVMRSDRQAVVGSLSSA